MPASKHATKRYLIIDRCLASTRKKYWSTEELLREIREKDIKINERSLRYDIEAMRYDLALNYNAPIAYSKKEQGYYYTVEGYSIVKINLTSEQKTLIEFLIKAVKEYQDQKVLQEFRGVIEKLV